MTSETLKPEFRVARKLAPAVELNLIQHLLRGKDRDKTWLNLFCINLDRMNRYAMIM
jgi:hypothetical protein